MMEREQPATSATGSDHVSRRKERLPDVVRLFPLRDHVFLPGFPSPYRVFEPRYRALVEDLLALPDHEQWIAIPQLRPSTVATSGDPPFASLAAVGRVLHVHPLPNLQFLIVVGEAHRARLNEVTSAAPYRQARVLERPAPHDASAENEGALQAVFERVLQTVMHLSPAWDEARDTVVEAMRRAPSMEDRVDLLGSLFLQSVDDRQAFLASLRIQRRLERIEDALLRGDGSALVSGPDSGGPQALA